jgi:hypothetical protein
MGLSQSLTSVSNRLCVDPEANITFVVGLQDGTKIKDFAKLKKVVEASYAYEFEPDLISES